MIIIVEGIDRVGKTTLCNKLQQELNIPIYKHKNDDYSKMDNDNETDKMLQLLDLYALLNGNIIFDRFHWSDYVYGILERNYNCAKASKNLMKIEKKLHELDAIIIYVRPTSIARSSSEHGKELKLHNALMTTASSISLSKIYECTFLSIDSVIKEVKDEYRL